MLQYGVDDEPLLSLPNSLYIEYTSFILSEEHVSIRIEQKPDLHLIVQNTWKNMQNKTFKSPN